MPGGRPTEYDEKLSPKLAKSLAKQGLFDEEIALEMGISTRTFYLWKRDKPEFLQAVEEGKETADEMIVNSLRKRALGYTLTLTKEVAVSQGKDCGSQLEMATFQQHVPADVKAIEMWLHNRKPEKWTAKPKESSESSVLNINFNAVTDDSNVELHIPVKKEEKKE